MLLFFLLKKGLLPVEYTPPFEGRGISIYLSKCISILGNLYPNRGGGGGVKGPFVGMFVKKDL